jgi:outer membrane protein assembly factor BamD (BamD/ComL family)
MRDSCHIRISLFLILVITTALPAFAQLGFDLKVDKPEPFENRVLRSEKTGDKELKAPKKFFQNLTTHYNYFFNATTKINDVIDGAKQAFRDDYTQLLPFYNYTLDVTAQNTLQLDSVIYKSKTGIVMHDLRNDWIDNMYLLWGAAWFFEKKFDSASLMFQFINYAFAEKEKDGYYKYIGSRLDGNNALTIATKEKSGFPKNTVTPPSRNNAFIWQIRTLIEQGNYPEAGSLIATLKNDPVFPKRLNDDLEEVQAYWFYKQNVWDSSASHLVNALSLAKTKQERARWEYLAAQMFERSHDFAQAQKFYSKSISHTTDPVMDIYSRLNLVRINKEGGENYIDKNIAELLKMAKRDKYVDYRDVIYFMAAQMELERNNPDAAQALLLKASKYNNGNLSSGANSYLLIADLSYDQKKYLQAASFYDSVNLKDFDGAELERIQSRRTILAKVISYSNSIAKEDSLQRIAAMTEEDRTAYINKLVKQLSKGQATDALTSGNAMMNSGNDLFSNNQTRGEWIFYNSTLKAQGYTQFKQVWGTRPNVDNWRRFSDISLQLINKVPTNTNNPKTDIANNLPLDNTPTYENLLSHVPLTDGQMAGSNDSLIYSLFSLGTVYMNDMENYPSAIAAFERIRKQFPGYKNMSELLFDLYYAYKKLGNQAEADKMKQILIAQYPNSRYASILTTGKDPAEAGGRSGEATKAYEAIYNLFIEGKFEEAEAAKKQADQQFQTSYWQPQLLYIDAVYQIRQRNDSVAKNILQTLIGQDPNSPLAQKAQTMISVLGRRNQIEAELANYQMQNQPVDTTKKASAVQSNPVVQNPPVRKDTVAVVKTNNTPVIPPPVKVDTTAKKNKPASVYSFDSSSKHFTVIVLDKVDPLFVNEVKNAYFRFNREKFGKAYTMNVVDLDADKKLLLIGDFASAGEAVNYMQSAKRAAPGEVMPWLKSDKYSFSIITAPNLAILLEKKDLNQYRQFLDQNLPGKLN